LVPVKNLFGGASSSRPDELVETLLETGAFRLERIVSIGHATPAGEWYDQERDEWVVLLSGRAGLRFADRDDVVEMLPGDHLVIPAHRRHRVEWTDAAQPTVWLALHY